MNPCAARVLFRQGLVQRLGLLVMRGWSQLIIERFRDAVTNHPSSLETPGFGADSGVDFSGNTRRGGYCGMNVPGLIIFLGPRGAVLMAEALHQSLSKERPRCAQIHNSFLKPGRGFLVRDEINYIMEALG